MENYLSHRWPKGPGVQPPPMPSPQPPEPPKPKKRGVRRWLVPTVAIVLTLALLAGVSFWAVNGIAELFANATPTLPEYPGPRNSREVFHDESDWTVDDLPWGRPDPSVQLSVEPAAGDPLPGRDIHQQALPSMVYIEAREKGRFHLYSHSGTGVIVTDSGYVLTNFHIIDGADRVQISLLTGRDTYSQFDAKVIGLDEDFDIAVLKFEPEEELTPARLGDSDGLAVGDRVYAEGNPMGYLVGSMSDGIVSALGRDDEVDGNGIGMIQTTAALNPGNSGGALLNEQGQVVGITSAKITGLVTDEGDSIEDAAVIENIGLAIPITDILPFVNHILATGKSCRPSIGITCSEAVEDGRRGLRVASVNDGVPAQEAGLERGDLIVAANGRPVGSLSELRHMLYRTGVDGEITCTVVREGAELDITFTLVDIPVQNP